MSRIGKQPIEIPAGVTVSVKDRLVNVKGPKGSLSERIPAGITVAQEGNTIQVGRRDDSKTQRSFHGMSRALIANLVTGVSKGFSKDLEIHGVGYRAEIKGKVVDFSLGYSHPVEFPIPDGIEIKVDKNTRLTVSGCSLQQVGQVAADIRALRKPDVYKQKGIRYAGEQLRKKAGKTGA